MLNEIAFFQSVCEYIYSISTSVKPALIHSFFVVCGGFFVIVVVFCFSFVLSGKERNTKEFVFWNIGKIS